jgi:AcrR family transcriptional regulator
VSTPAARDRPARDRPARDRPARDRPAREPAEARPSSRDRILAAAVRRIASDGIDDVRIARIAMDAGVSPALVHYHFDSRETLLAQALDYSYTRAGDARISSGEIPGASHAERLRSMIGQCLPTTRSLAEDWVLWVELWLRAVRHSELRPVAEELYGRLRTWFAEEISAGIEDGEFGSDVAAEEVADRTLALIDGFGIRALIGDSRVPLHRAREAIEDSLARDLGLAQANRAAAR